MTIQDAIKHCQELDGSVYITRQSWNKELELFVVDNYLCMEAGGGFTSCTAPFSVDDLLADDWTPAS